MVEKVHHTQIPLGPPPGHHIQYAGCHWVRRMDYDGHPGGLEVYQWQPGAQKWCRVNEYAQDRDLELLGYVYVALCPMPPFEEEVEEARKAYDHAVKQAVASLQGEQLRYMETLSRLINEHVFNVHPKKKG